MFFKFTSLLLFAVSSTFKHLLFGLMPARSSPSSTKLKDNKEEGISFWHSLECKDTSCKEQSGIASALRSCWHSNYPQWSWNLSHLIIIDNAGSQRDFLQAFANNLQDFLLLLYNHLCRNPLLVLIHFSLPLEEMGWGGGRHCCFFQNNLSKDLTHCLVISSEKPLSHHPSSTRHHQRFWKDYHCCYIFSWTFMLHHGFLVLLDDRLWCWWKQDDFTRVSSWVTDASPLLTTTVVSIGLAWLALR